MNPSTDLEILTYLKTNFQRLSWVLPASKFFTNKIRTYQRHLDKLFDFWLNDENFKLQRKNAKWFTFPIKKVDFS